MKYAIDMGSGAVIYIPSLIKICSGIQKFHNKESRLKTSQRIYICAWMSEGV
jgi:hypothetical protein